MTRISLKEQYDNSSVIKQIADLTDQIDGFDTDITEAKTLATEASSTASTAKSTAEAASSAASAAKTTADSAVAKNTEQDSTIATIQLKDSEQDLKIAAIQTKDTEQDTSITALQTIANTLANEVINSVNVVDGTQNGSIMVRLADVGGRVISSPNYPWGQVATFTLKQGAQSGYVYGELTLSDGEVIRSNDYQILQITESDIYVTSITLTPYPTLGKLGGTIGYSNGNSAEINIVDIPTAPGVTTNINDLLSRMGVAEASINELDTRVKAIEDTPGVGAFTNTTRGTILGSTEDGKVSANDDGTGSVSGWSKVATAQSAAEAAKTAAALAQSTADDVNNKANGAIDDVSFSNNILTFTKINDTQIEIPISSFDLIDKTGYFPIDSSMYSTISSTASYNMFYLSYSYKIPIFCDGHFILVNDFKPSLSTVTSSTVCIFNQNGMNSLASQILSGIGLSDGVYCVKYFLIGKIENRSELSYYTGNADNGGSFICKISDGELISVETGGWEVTTESLFGIIVTSISKSL